MKRLFAVFAMIVMLAAALPLASLAETYATVISNDVLYLRSEPAMGDNIIGKYRTGTKVEVLSTKYRNWVRVRTPRGQVGYMYKKYLSAFTNTGTIRTGSVRTITSDNGGPVNLRRRASTKAPLMDRLNVGTKVTVVYSGDVWTRVKVNGKDGWVMTKFLRK